jgi:anti-sigma regulatory factor (Ser/Thr protein kinase)
MTASTIGAWTGDRFAHEAFVFDADDQAAARVVPFVEDGLALGQRVIVVAGPLVRDLVVDALGERVADLTVLAAAEEFWQGGHQTLATYRESMEPLLADGRPWRLVGEPTWLSTPGGHTWSRFEAVANDAFAQFPYYSLCLHDRRRLTREALEAQLRVHPLVWDGGAPVASADYEPTTQFLARVEPPTTPAPPHARTLHVEDLASARAALQEWVAPGAAAGRTTEVLLAVYELVVNAVRASGAARVDSWAEGPARLWQVSDHGPGLDDATAGYVPPERDLESGRGLWLARSLADDSAVRGSEQGTVVRLLFWSEDR